MPQLKNHEGNQSLRDTQSPKKRVLSDTFFTAKKQRLQQQEELQQVFKVESENGIRQEVSLKETNELFSMIKNSEGNKSIERSYHPTYRLEEITDLWRENGKWMRTIIQVSKDSSGGYIEGENEEISEQKVIEGYFTSLPHDAKIFIKTKGSKGKREWKPGTHKE